MAKNEEKVRKTKLNDIGGLNMDFGVRNGSSIPSELRGRGTSSSRRPKWIGRGLLCTNDRVWYCMERKGLGQS